VSKFVGKFRKNSDYNEDYEFASKRRRRDEKIENRKIKNYNYEDYDSDYGKNTKKSHKVRKSY
jgi:hypothetical protein